MEKKTMDSDKKEAWRISTESIKDAVADSVYMISGV